MNSPGRDRGGLDGSPEDVDEGSRRYVELSEEQLAALGSFHSGLAEVCVQEWAVLLRCDGDKPVQTDELVGSLLDWFPAPLSAGEISTFTDRLVERGFLFRLERGAAFQTTPLGSEVLKQSEAPLLKGAMWVLGKKDDEGDEHVDH